MRKFTVVLLSFVFFISLAGSALAQLVEKQAELAKVKQYLVLLDKKIEEARTTRKINKLAELKELKRRELARAKLLKAQVEALKKQGGSVQPSLVQPEAPAEQPLVKPAAKPVLEPARQRGLALLGGFGAGAGLLKIGYIIPNRNLDLGISGGFAVGNSFSVVTADVSAAMLFGHNFAGLELGLASYSKTVQNVPGISGTIGGSNFGLGAFGGTNLTDNISVRVGYNTALGLTALAGIKF
ncbi:MAG: hypothetical protein JW782_02495 [Candidatus Saganbacteria bacterium]|nr:hypothetical protein [Candidatus Saganbacteria bacterium]